MLLAAINSFAQSKRLLLQHINVVDVEKGKILPDQTVAITGDRISAIHKASSFKTIATDSLVNGTGQYLIPGLWDMHTHVWAPDYFFSLFIANGITGIRGMFEQALAANQWRQRGLTAGELVPRGYYAGPILDGPKPIWPGSIGVTDAARGHKLVDSLKNQLKVDFIKVYSLLEKDAFYGIAEEAKKQGIPFAGHVPNKITLLEAVKAGQKVQNTCTALLKGRRIAVITIIAWYKAPLRILCCPTGPLAVNFCAAPSMKRNWQPYSKC